MAKALAEQDREQDRKQGSVGKLSIEKRRTVEDDGRYLIYYAFAKEGEDEASSPGDERQDGEPPGQDRPAREEKARAAYPGISAAGPSCGSRQGADGR